MMSVAFEDLLLFFSSFSFIWIRLLFHFLVESLWLKHPRRTARKLEKLSSNCTVLRPCHSDNIVFCVLFCVVRFEIEINFFHNIWTKIYSIDAAISLSSSWMDTWIICIWIASIPSDFLNASRYFHTHTHTEMFPLLNGWKWIEQYGDIICLWNCVCVCMGGLIFWPSRLMATKRW